MSRVSPARYRALRDADAQRGKLGLSHADIAELSGLAQRAIGSWMRGVSWPQAPSQAKLEYAIGWPAGELRRREDYYERTPQLGARWNTDELYRLRIANLILRSGRPADDLPAGVSQREMDATRRGDAAVPFAKVLAIAEYCGVDLSQVDGP